MRVPFVVAVCVLALFVNVADATRVVTGLHFDVEPHALPEFHTSKKQWLVDQYIELLGKLKTAIGRNPLCLTADVPMAFRHPASDSSSKPIMRSVLEKVDRITLMDYRDEADGDKGYGGLIKLGQPFVDLGDEMQKPVVIGVETVNEEPEYISFFHEGGTVMERELGKTAVAFKNSRFFDNFAVHSTKSYMAISKPFNSKPAYPRDSWLWNYKDFFGKPAAIQSLFAWAKKNNIRTFYIEAQDMVQTYTDKKKVKALIDAAGANGICLEFLFGYHPWAYRQNHAKAVELVNLAVKLLRSFGTDYTTGTATCSCPFRSTSPPAASDLEEEKENEDEDNDLFLSAITAGGEEDVDVDADVNMVLDSNDVGTETVSEAVQTADDL